MNHRQLDAHLTDETLLLLREGELSPRELNHARAHLAVCQRCAQRQAQLQAADDSVHEAARISANSAQNDQARSRLQQSLAQAAAAAPARRTRLAGFFSPRTALRFGAVAAVVLVCLGWWQIRSAESVVQAGSVPDRILTPGSAHPAELTELCSLDDDTLDPEVSPEKAQEVFRSYRIQPGEQTAYQVDYLINPQLGGDDHIENLWPEPYNAPAWNARAKDALERRMHTMVCNREITLQQAQNELRTNWIAAYKKYFGTREPDRTPHAN